VSTEDTRHEREVATCFVVTTIAALALAGVYIAGGQPQAEGALLAVALLALGAGLVVWGSTLIPHDEVTGPRGHDEELDEDLDDDRGPDEVGGEAGGEAGGKGGEAGDHAAERAEQAEVRRDVAGSFERGAGPIGRRSFLGKLLALAGGALGFALVFPVRSLGPDPERALKRTSWRPGSRVVTEDGTPVKVADLGLDSVLTVFPEGATEAEDSQVILINVGNRLRPRHGRADWAPQGVVAYSKICTHAGCPVGLYRRTSHELLCPCHQSTFDVLDGCRPVFGPATRSLPQLPLAVNEAGELVARRDFTEAVGPAYWSRP
jgi:ubiquinol-cytochrome c reductase iron-sulfur subunit